MPNKDHVQSYLHTIITAMPIRVPGKIKHSKITLSPALQGVVSFPVLLLSNFSLHLSNKRGEVWDVLKHTVRIKNYA